MTITQLERYMISEIENLHIKIDNAFGLLMQQIEKLAQHLIRIENKIDEHEVRLVRIEGKLDTHERRLIKLEN